ncbi:MAG TPA: PHP domain-containing protein [Spirochaetota bacterium]|nr:PHP domain-containing protein [Spirochaetota bacterium]
MSGIDLHIHSSFSDDGDYSVGDIFQRAKEHSLEAIAVTDHDTLSHIGECVEYSTSSGVELVPGFEITTMHPMDASQQHILCYFADPGNIALRALCNRIRSDRIELARERFHALEKIGFNHDPSIIDHKKDSQITATTIVKEILSHPDNTNHPLLQKYFSGPCKDDRIMCFYREFLASGKPGYVPFRSIPTKDAIITVINAHAVPVLAHPVQVKSEAILDDIRSSGIIGIEVYSSYHTPDDTKRFCDYAKTNHLIATAGSDFHGPTAKPHVGFASITGNYETVSLLRNSIQ